MAQEGAVSERSNNVGMGFGFGVDGRVIVGDACDVSKVVCITYATLQTSARAPHLAPRMTSGQRY